MDAEKDCSLKAAGALGFGVGSSIYKQEDTPAVVRTVGGGWLSTWMRTGLTVNEESLKRSGSLSKTEGEGCFILFRSAMARRAVWRWWRIDPLLLKKMDRFLSRQIVKARVDKASVDVFSLGPQLFYLQTIKTIVCLPLN